MLHKARCYMLKKVLWHEYFRLIPYGINGIKVLQKEKETTVCLDRIGINLNVFSV